MAPGPDAAEAGGLAIVVLAGGRASRFPHKLERDAGGLPLLARVLCNVTSDACNRALAREAVVVAAADNVERIRGLLERSGFAETRLLVDDAPDRGPLGGLLTACRTLDVPWVFACAGDAPRVDAGLIDELVTAHEANDEAVVAVHGDAPTMQREPLAALYRRVAVLREGPAVLARGAALHALLARLRTREVRADRMQFMNINTPDDYAEYRRNSQ